MGAKFNQEKFQSEKVTNLTKEMMKTIADMKLCVLRILRMKKIITAMNHRTNVRIANP